MIALGASQPAAAGRREWTGLAVLALPTLLASIDVSIMLLALPHISASLGADAVQQLWIMDIYGFMLAGFLVTMGTLGDRIGRRKLLLIGGSAFGLASVAAALASTPPQLIAARGLLGVAGATLAPSTLALISNMFRLPKQRAFAISIWLACFMGGMAIGPLVGGALLEHFWWGAVFLIGVPVMVLLLVSAPFFLPEYRAPQPGRLDLPSVALSLAAILPVIYGLKELARVGFEPLPAAAVLAGLLVGVLFVARQRTLRSPLIDLTLFKNRAFSTALGGMFGVTLTGATMLFITQHLQFVEHLSPLQAGLCMLPAVCASTIGFLVSPVLARRWRPARLIATGLVVAAGGALLLTRVEGGPPSLPLLVAGWVLFSAGCAPLVSLATDIVVGAAPPDKAGSAASVSETSAEFAFALGIAILGSLGAARYRADVTAALPAELPAAVVDASRESLATGVVAAAALPSPQAELVRLAVESAFSSSMQAVAVICAAILLIVAGLVLVMLRHLRPLGQPTAEAESSPRAATGTTRPVHAAG